jgi:hypothetical protein
MGSKAAKAIAKTPALKPTKKAATPAKTSAAKKGTPAAKTEASLKHTTPELESSTSSADVPLAAVRATKTAPAANKGPKKTIKDATTLSIAKTTAASAALSAKTAGSKKRKAREIEDPDPDPESKTQTLPSKKAGIFSSVPLISASRKRKIYELDSDESEFEAETSAQAAKKSAAERNSTRAKNLAELKKAFLAQKTARVKQTAAAPKQLGPTPKKKVLDSRPGSGTPKPNSKLPASSLTNRHTSDELQAPAQTSSPSNRSKAALKKNNSAKPVPSDDESSSPSSSAKSRNHVSDSSTDLSKCEEEFDDPGPEATAGQPAQMNAHAPQGGESGHEGEDESSLESGEGADDAYPPFPPEDDPTYDVSPLRSNPGANGSRESTASVHDLIHPRNPLQIEDLIRLIGQQLQRDFDYAAVFNLRRVSKQCWEACEKCFFRSFHHFTIVLAPEFVTWAQKLLSNRAICDRIKLVSFDAPPLGYGYDISRPQDLRVGLYNVLRHLHKVETVEFARLQKLHPKLPKLSSRDKLWRKESDLDFYYYAVLKAVGQWPAPVERLTNHREEDDTRVWEHEEANTLPSRFMPLDCFINHAQTPLATFWVNRFHALITAELDVGFRTDQMTSEAQAFLLCGLKNAQDLRLGSSYENEPRLDDFAWDLGASFRLGSPHLRNLSYLTVYGPVVTQYNFPWLLKRMGPRLVGVSLRKANLAFRDVKWPFIAGMARFLKHWIGRKGQFPNLQDFMLEVLWKEKHRFHELPLNNSVWEMRNRRDVQRPDAPWKAFWRTMKADLETLNDVINDGDVSSDEVSSSHAAPTLPSETESSDSD